MRLKEYLQIASITQKKLADLIGVKPSTLNNWLQGLRAPSQYHQELIRKATKGKVDCQEFLE